MGFAISWLAVKGKSKAEVLAALRLEDTDEIDEANDEPISGDEFPNGWYVLFLNDYDHALIQPASLSALSVGCEVIACRIEEHVMASSATLYANGQRVWSIAHQGDGEDIYDLTVEGTPPKILAGIRSRLTKDQESEGGRAADVDYIFDIPLDVACAICGYRHDQAEYDWGEPEFTALVAAK
jgi:hypothetical protein